MSGWLQSQVNDTNIIMRSSDDSLITTTFFAFNEFMNKPKSSSFDSFEKEEYYHFNDTD